MKSAIFDIETTALEGVGSGIILCACVRPMSTKRTRTFRLQYRDDWKAEESGFLETEETELLKELTGELKTYDLLIGHNIEKFDLPQLRTRCFRRALEFSITPFTYDTMRAFGRTRFRTVLNGFGKPSKSMAMIGDFLGIDQLKTAIYPVEHWFTVWGNVAKREESMKNIIDHCERDVRMNMQMYEMLLPYDYKATIKRWM